MTTYRGMDGALVLGGILSGSPLVNGAKIAGSLTLNLDAASLIGVIHTGDTFTVAGETGLPVHTVTNGPYVAVANAVVGLTFTTVVAVGGIADNAAITFASNSMANVRSWGMNAALQILDTSAMGQKWRTVSGGTASFDGEAEAMLDGGDLKQLALLNAIATGTPPGLDAGMVFKSDLNKQFYGSCVCSNFRVVSASGALVLVRFSFAGSGAVLPNWT